jgi:hypothetical protein
MIEAPDAVCRRTRRAGKSGGGAPTGRGAERLSISPAPKSNTKGLMSPIRAASATRRGDMRPNGSKLTGAPQPTRPSKKPRVVGPDVDLGPRPNAPGVPQRFDGDQRGHRRILEAAHTTFNVGQWHMRRPEITLRTSGRVAGLNCTPARSLCSLLSGSRSRQGLARVSR